MTIIVHSADIDQPDSGWVAEHSGQRCKNPDCYDQPTYHQHWRERRPLPGELPRAQVLSELQEAILSVKSGEFLPHWLLASLPELNIDGYCFLPERRADGILVHYERPGDTHRVKRHFFIPLPESTYRALSSVRTRGSW